MLHFTSKKFKLHYKVKPENFFPMKDHIKQGYKDAIVKSRMSYIKRIEFGDLSFKGEEKTLPYGLNMRFWLDLNGVVKGKVEEVLLFQDVKEMEEYQAELRAVVDKLSKN